MKNHKKIWTIVVIGLLLVVALMFWVLRPQPKAVSDTPVAHKVVAHVEVRISEDGIEQPTVKIRPYTAVTWVNDDSIPHKLVPNDEKGKIQGIESDTIPPSQRYTHIFNTEGSFGYHEEDTPKATGTIIVKK